MKRRRSILSLLIALMWATGALDMLHHAGECHHTPPPAVDMLVESSTHNTAAAESDACALCIALSGGKCCGHEAPARLGPSTVSADLPPEGWSIRDRHLSSPHNRGPPRS